jgi:PHP family Zn ribbon phosphoesterase
MKSELSQRHTICPQCGSTLTKCVDSRTHSPTNGRRRRYVCRACSNRWTTLELSFDLLERLGNVQSVVNSLTHQLVELRSLLHALPLDKLGIVQMHDAEYGQHEHAGARNADYRSNHR